MFKYVVIADDLTGAADCAGTLVSRVNPGHAVESSACVGSAASVGATALAGTGSGVVWLWAGDAVLRVAGGMLGIKPLITIKEGKVVMAGKARGLPGAYVALFKKIEELGGISTCADALAGYTLAPREVQPIQTYLQENLGRSEALVRQIGCVIGTHAGPGAFGLAFLDEGFTGRV